jgi:hypothetical protein
MYKALKAFILVFYICCAGFNAFAQQNVKTANPEFSRLHDSLLVISNHILNAKENADRFSHNATFIKTLVQTLKLPNSYDFSFDSLSMVSVLKSPDNTFKIFSWFVPTNEGGFRYFGSIQQRSKDGRLNLLSLVDGTEHFVDSNAVSDHKKWFGSRYYEMVPITANTKDPYYVLLGWKGNNQKTSSKVIEVLSFKQDMPVFGKAVFEGSKDLSSKQRIIYTYHKLNSMTLRYDTKMKMIVLDHLAPYDPKMQGNYEFYASDSSFDGFTITKGKLKLVENIEVNNDPDNQDELYIDPTRKDIPAKKKF